MKAVLSTLVMIALLSVNGLSQKTVKSPPKTVKGQISNVDITIDYSSPAVKDRTTWGGQLVPYDKIWRTGANNATWIETSGDLMIEGKSLPAGKYSIFTIPHDDDTCTLIFNKEWEQWGHYKYKEAQDILRVDVRKTNTEANAERMDFEITDNSIILKWHDWQVAAAAK